MDKIFGFLRDESGLTMVEYAVAGSMVAAGAVGLFVILGDGVCDTIETLGFAVKGDPTVGAGGC